jgi:succinoglycan biosynthesis protein ExoL
MKIGFLLPFAPNPRMKKRIAFFSQEHQVSVVYWKRSKTNLFRFDEKPEYEAINVEGNYGNPLGRIIPTIIFAYKAISCIRKIRPDIIYTQGIDMLFVAWLYSLGKKRKPKLFYEVADVHSLLIDPQRGMLKKTAQKLLVRIDAYLCRHIDLLVNTSEKYYEVYFSKFVPKDKILVMPNVPEPSVFKDYERKVRGIFTVGFIGAIRYKEQLKMLIRVAPKTSVNVFFAGSAFDDEIEVLSQNKDWITYYGAYEHTTEAAKLYGMVDCIYSVYNADLANVRIALPNRLYEAIYCELPIIVAKGTYLAELVEKMGVGVAVSHKDETELEQVIKRLSTDKDYYNGFVNACRIHKKNISIEPYNNQLKLAIDAIMNK